VARGLGAALAALLLGGAPQQAPKLSGWLTYGNGPERRNFTPAGVAPRKLSGWHVQLDGGVLTQPLAVRDYGETTIYVGTTAGTLYALGETGSVRWQADLGGIDHQCRQLPSYGVTGTPAVDTRTRALYVADARGRLHALDLTTGQERPGWPVTLYQDFRQELVWGALLVANGSVYVPTGSYCDIPPMQGKLLKVAIASRRVKAWTTVPARLGGGGGIWGWGGVAYGASRRSILAAPGNAFTEKESAGYAEHLVELSPALRVRASNHPASVASSGDVDFGGAPMLVSPAGCGQLVAVPSKNGRLYAWRADAVRKGPAWAVDLRRLKLRYPLVTELAYSPPLRSIFVATGARLVRVRIGAECRPKIAWTHRLPPWAYNGSPTVAGDVVWLGVTRTKQLLGVDARSGKTRASVSLDGPALAAPTVFGGRLYIGSMAGGMYGFKAG
jgi:outer membrane protein assembly factor BamB